MKKVIKIAVFIFTILVAINETVQMVLATEVENITEEIRFRRLFRRDGRGRKAIAFCNSTSL